MKTGRNADAPWEVGPDSGESPRERERQLAGAVAVSWAGRALQVALGLWFTRLLFDRLDASEVGLWFLITRTAAPGFLLGFGLNTIVARHLALSRGAADRRPGGASLEVARLVRVARGLSLRASGVLFLLVSGVAACLLWRVELDGPMRAVLFLAWGAITLGQLFVVRSEFWGQTLAGLGRVSLAAGLSTFTQILQRVALIGGLLLGLRLGGLGALALASGVVGWLVSRAGARRDLPAAPPALAPSEAALLRRRLLEPAARWWLAALGGFLLLCTDGYFIALLRSPAELGPYSAAFQILQITHQLAIALGLAAVPFIAHAWAQGDLAVVRRLTYRSVRVALLVVGAVIAGLSLAGEDLFEVWLGPGHFVGWPVLGVFCVAAADQTHQVVLAACARATNDESFWPFALAAGALNLGLTAWLIHPLGLAGVALATVLARVATSSWYALVRAHRRLQLAPPQTALRVWLPAALVAAASLGVGAGLRALADAWGAGAAGRLLAVVCGCGAVLGGALAWELRRRAQRPPRHPACEAAPASDEPSA